MTKEMSVDEMVQRNANILNAKSSLIIASGLKDGDVASHAIRADNVRRGQYIKLAVIGCIALTLMILVFAFFIHR